MIEFPYGIADFRAIRRDGMVYLDRTAHIHEVEKLGRALVFLRPRRFGKSLWLQTLASYYDLRRADELEQLFGELAIGRQPTELHNRFFVLQWNLSEVDPSGGVERIGESLAEHVRAQVRAFAKDYAAHLPATPDATGSPGAVLIDLLGILRQTSHKLYLLIDEYDNFANEVMTRDVGTYRALLSADGPFKQLFKSVKAALEGRGLERIFITGVSPVALNDLTSGFNVARDVSQDPALATLCGFRDQEIRRLLERISEENGLPEEAVGDAAETMRTWYNGYRFTPAPPEASDSQAPLVYNPANSLYFLEHIYRFQRAPRELHDQNLRTDHAKLAFLARTSSGAEVIEELTEGDGSVGVSRLAGSFSLDDLTRRVGKDRSIVASLLYYMGFLTLADQPTRLRVPNLVVRKLFLERLLELYLPATADSSQGREAARVFLEDGTLSPLLGFFEKKLLPVLSNRDRGFAPSRPGLSGSGVNETVVKSLFLALLFDDTRYLTFSEPEIERGYADLCLIVRPEMRRWGYFDLLFELKLVRLKEIGQPASELREMTEETLRALPVVARALSAAQEQAARYRRSLESRFGPALHLRCYCVVAVDLERMVGDEVT